MKRYTILLISFVNFFVSTPGTGADLRDDFPDPPLEYKTRPLWFWNAPPDAVQTRTIMQRSGTAAITASASCRPRRWGCRS